MKLLIGTAEVMTVPLIEKFLDTLRESLVESGRLNYITPKSEDAGGVKESIKVVIVNDDSLGDITNLKNKYTWVDFIKSNKNLGRTRLRNQNFKWLAHQYLNGNWKLSLDPTVELNAMHAIFGGDYPGYPHLHKIGLDDKNLSQALKDVGVTEITNVSNPGSWELRMEGVRSGT